MNHHFIHPQKLTAGISNGFNCAPYQLVYTPYAAKRQLDIVGWLRDDYPENRNEQGGWLIGRYIRDSSGQTAQAEVTEIFQARTECRTPGYIEWSAMEEIRMQKAFFDMKDQLALSNPTAASELSVVGWWHTHPNHLPVFMSETDLQTQQLKYNKPEKFAVVLNPHKGIYRVFAGQDAIEVAAIMLYDAEEAPAVSALANRTKRQKKDERICRKQNRHKKRCRSVAKKWK